MPGELTADAGLSVESEISRVMKSVIDRLQQEISTRFTRLSDLNSKFGFLLDVENLLSKDNVDNDLEKKCESLVYPKNFRKKGRQKSIVPQAPIMLATPLQVHRANHFALFMKVLFHIIEGMILIDAITQHQTNIEGNMKLGLGSVLRKEYVTKKKEEIRRQNIFTKLSCEDLAMTEAFYEIALVLAKKTKPFSGGEEIFKPCLQIFASHLGNKDIERKGNEIALSRQTVTRRIEELSQDVSQQLEDIVHSCTFFSLASEESTDICDVAQLSIFIRGIDDNFNLFEELASLESLYGKTRGSDIFEKVKSYLDNLKLDDSKLISVCVLMESCQ
ncbi:hypothetical protein CBL_02962 [Carabus blaptoides fortunei]